MVKINEVMKEELCLELDRWRQSRLKLAKNKSVEMVNSGDLVMIRRMNNTTLLNLDWWSACRTKAETKRYFFNLGTVSPHLWATKFLLPPEQLMGGLPTEKTTQQTRASWVSREWGWSSHTSSPSPLGTRRNSNELKSSRTCYRMSRVLVKRRKPRRCTWQWGPFMGARKN